MILTRIGAVNFLNFRELDLRDPPRQGIIGILSAGDEGRSAIGEAIAFALFGRLLHGANGDSTAAIRDGDEFAEVELCFELPGRGAYRIFREIDRQGDHLVQLERVDERHAVTGIEPVSRALDQLLRYSFADFRHGFYLATGELGSGGPGELLAEAPGDGGRVAMVRRELAMAEEREVMAAAAARVAAAAARVAAAEVTLAERAGHLAAQRAALEAREELGRRLDRHVAAARATAMAEDLAGLERTLRDRMRALPETQAALAVESTARRRQGARERELRAALARFEQGVDARRRQIGQELLLGQRGSLVDSRLVACARVAHLEGRGRFQLGLGLLVVGGGCVLAGMLGLRRLILELPSEIGKPLGGPELSRHLPAEPPPGWGAALLVGLTMIITGLWRRRVGRQAAAARKREVEALDRRIEALESELRLLSDADLTTLVHRCLAAEIGDPKLRELASRIAALDPGRPQSDAVIPGVDQDDVEPSVAEVESFGRELVRIEVRFEEVAMRLHVMAARLGRMADSWRPRPSSGRAPAFESMQPLAAAIDSGTGARAGERLAEVEALLGADPRAAGDLGALETAAARLSGSLPSVEALSEGVRAAEAAHASARRRVQVLRAELGARRSEDQRAAGAIPGRLWDGRAGDVALALRLAQAEMLLRARGLPAAHFLFLDRPLGKIDRSRAEGMLRLLRELSPTFGQIFLATEDDDAGAAYDMAVRLDPEVDEIRVLGPTSAPAPSRTEVPV